MMYHSMRLSTAVGLRPVPITPSIQSARPVTRGLLDVEGTRPFLPASFVPVRVPSCRVVGGAFRLRLALHIVLRKTLWRLPCTARTTSATGSRYPQSSQ